MLRERLHAGRASALEKLGLAQPSLQSVGIRPPVKAPRLPGPASTPNLSIPSLKLDPSPSVGEGPMTLGMRAAKVAFNVGMGASNSSDGAGATRGEPADAGRRQRSVIDRTFQQNDDFFASSSMPAPGGQVSP